MLSKITGRDREDGGNIGRKLGRDLNKWLGRQLRNIRQHFRGPPLGRVRWN